MKLIFGLGNPGAKYDGTRHNIGFSILDNIVLEKNISFSKPNPLFEIAELLHNEIQTLFIKPLTYMNLSGEVVKFFFNNFPDLTTKDILVVYDDIHLPLGKIRFRGKGSDGGHNGIKNITQLLESDKYDRLRFGVDQPQGDLIEHVLGHFNTVDSEVLNKTIETSIKGILYWIEQDLEKTMSTFNSIDLRPSNLENTDSE